MRQTTERWLVTNRALEVWKQPDGIPAIQAKIASPFPASNAGFGKNEVKKAHIESIARVRQK